MCWECASPCILCGFCQLSSSLQTEITVARKAPQICCTYVIQGRCLNLAPQWVQNLEASTSYTPGNDVYDTSEFDRDVIFTIFEPSGISDDLEQSTAHPLTFIGTDPTSVNICTHCWTLNMTLY